MKPAFVGIRERRIGIAVSRERETRSIEFSARGAFSFLMCARGKVAWLRTFPRERTVFLSLRSTNHTVRACKGNYDSTGMLRDPLRPTGVTT